MESTSGGIGLPSALKLEDWSTGPSNLEQIKRAKEIIDSVGRPVVTGAEAIEYLDIAFPATRPKA